MTRKRNFLASTENQGVINNINNINNESNQNIHDSDDVVMSDS